jgi:hypothetical protein
MRIRFWGTRGSLAKPGPTTLRYGGNTSCVEVWMADGTLIVLDCGTGTHGLAGGGEGRVWKVETSRRFSTFQTRYRFFVFDRFPTLREAHCGHTACLVTS